MIPLISAHHLTKHFRHRGGGEAVVALDDVSIEVAAGESVAVVGESGSGKSTLGRCLMGLIPATSGDVHWQGQNLARVGGKGVRQFRRDVQMVFQDPYDSLDPRMDVRSALREPLVIHGWHGPALDDRVRELLHLVRLNPSFLGRLPHQLSGGQQQRVGIARALANQPKLLILDEPTSALDWLVRGEILELLNDLRARLGLTYVFISHDLSAVRRVTERAIVMYLGQVVERALTSEVFERPEHPYTRALLSAALRVEPGRRRRLHLLGEPPQERPAGCPLHPRCPVSVQACSTTVQMLELVAPAHAVACMRVTGGEEIDWPEGWLSVGGATADIDRDGASA